ncbi:MAG TPA: hypothetical protein VJT72_03320 [Pseudonocardiaceae bacterium]|nr:hypothetical protein [Pseudonocardiaceae bacterium]
MRYARRPARCTAARGPTCASSALLSGFRFLGHPRWPLVVPRVQPGRQWGWLAEKTSLPIADAIADELVDALDLQPGHRVLEIGTGTGYHTALLRLAWEPRRLPAAADRNRPRGGRGVIPESAWRVHAHAHPVRQPAPRR